MNQYYERYWSGLLPSMRFFGNPPTKEQALEVLDLVKEWKKGYKTLDYGTGEGHLVAALPGAEGVDISEEAIKRAYNLYPNKEFYKINTMPDKSYHNIVASDVFEHVFDFDATFEFIDKHLMEGGRLMIATNEMCLSKLVIIGLFHMHTFFSPWSPHIRFFTRKSMNELLTHYGYRIIHIERRGNYAGLISRGMFVVAEKETK